MSAIEHRGSRGHRGGGTEGAQRAQRAPRAQRSVETRAKSILRFTVLPLSLCISSVFSGDLCVLSAQGRFTNARTETRSAAQGVEREVRAVASRGGAAWVGYRVPMIAGPRQMCCYDSFSDGNACCGV